ncbi:MULTISPECIES: Gfo/Idh/MocA family protein [unclassified Meiothermus]|uniref:Gfo/Idh/MocA family protein n=1 Tax=unclassified Meiothermus TaxID=370471 RepID=UPI000D7C3D10|nr:MULTISPECIES: Gfo/Idh/MocA family oxidoreductase [unclassified Meiothermus]PZA06300.1 gfo/Idh/MocA family oxidoreductase [Meiothermus sp. Pnk-1]RYM36373.1 Gfo/Idh/MocA family oxidoreductase [Meiothermus sp. PNK-Is4]
MIKVGIVGTGFIGPVHVEALRRIGVEVKGVLGSSPEKSRRAAEYLGLEQGYASYAEMLSDPEVAVVHLTSPNRFHREQVLRALEAGKHVICEKPLGMNTQETKELLAAAQQHPELVTAVNYNLRFYPLCLQAREMVRRGEIGEVFHVKGSYVQDWLLYPTDFNWRVLAEEGGELRAIGDIGTHWLDLVSFITGLEVEEVMADLYTVHPIRQRPPAGSVETFSGKKGSREAATEPVKITTEDYASVLLRFAGGKRGVLTVSQVTAGRKNRIEWEIAGSERALAWNGERPNELWIGERNAANRLLIRDPSLLEGEAARYTSYPGGHNEGFPDTFKQLYRAVYADIKAGRASQNPLYATFEDGHKELALCEAILESSKQGQWVRVRY